MRPRLHPARGATRILSRQRKIFVYAILGATWCSGAAWLVLHYFLMRNGQFGPEPNPLEFWMLALHGACAFAALWLGGWLWSMHVLPWWRGGRRRVSGIILIGMAAVLIVSGYLLYYASGDGTRAWIALLHWWVGLALAVPVLVHALRSGRYRGAAR